MHEGLDLGSGAISFFFFPFSLSVGHPSRPVLATPLSQITAHHQTWMLLPHPRNQWPCLMAPCFLPSHPRMLFLVTPGRVRPNLPWPFREDCFFDPFLFQSDLFPLIINSRICNLRMFPR